MSTHTDTRPKFMRFVRRFAVPILLGWLLLTVALNVLVPPIESVARNHAVTMSPQDAPAMVAAKRIGATFHESDSDSTAMIVLDSDRALGDEARRYYDGLVTKLQADPKHAQHVQNVWGDPLTAAGVQSRDGKAAYVQLNLAGNQGSTRGNESVKAVRDIVSNLARPPGLNVYVTGPAPLTTDMNEAADKSMFMMMGVTGVVIMIMLFVAYRSISTVLLVLVMVGFEMGTARGLVALLGNNGLLGFSTFVVAMLSSLAIAAGTDYAIFLIGRYQEARHAGQDRETAYYTMFRGTVHIILGSGLTIAGATFCLHLARLSYFKALGIPVRAGVARRRRRRAHRRAGRGRRRQPIRSARSETGRQGPPMAAGRHRYRALARPRARGLAGHRRRRRPRHAEHEGQLQRPLLHPRRPAIERRIRRRGAPFQRRDNESRHPHGRERSRHA